MSTACRSIICCGFTPCIQRILEFQHVEKGAVNRAGKVTLGIGGKGANTTRMVKQLGGDGLLVGFAGGANGQLLEEMLTSEGVTFHHVEVEGETRICQTLVEAGNPETTELVEEMPPITPVEWNSMLTLLHSMPLGESIVTLSGKLPAGAPVDAYAKVASLVSRSGGRIILDAPGEPLLLALEHEPFMVKINDVELLQTVGSDDLIDACMQIIGRGARSVLVTRGARSAFFVDERQTLELFPPKIEAINPVGSGDAVTAGLAVALSEGETVSEILVNGMACGAANALNLISGMLTLEDVNRLRSEVRIEAVT
jgi:tagatose 6-phosphate kinase